MSSLWGDTDLPESEGFDNALDSFAQLWIDLVKCLAILAGILTIGFMVGYLLAIGVSYLVATGSTPLVLGIGTVVLGVVTGWAYMRTH